MTLPLVAVLIHAARNPDLLADHTHDGWILQDLTSCPRCQAERAVLVAARRMLEEGVP